MRLPNVFTAMADIAMGFVVSRPEFSVQSTAVLGVLLLASALMYTAAQYLGLLQGLLPTGPAWPRDPDATLTKLLSAEAEEFARLD